MATMQSFEIPFARIAEVRKMIPTGVEHYVIADRSSSYINIRSDDHALVKKLAEHVCR